MRNALKPFVLAMIGLAVACGSDDEALPSVSSAKVPDLVGMPSEPPTPWMLTEATKPTRLRLALDESESMAGYTRTAGLPLHKLMNRLEAAALTLGIGNFEARTFNDKAGLLRTIKGPPELLAFPTRAARTCLSVPLAGIAAAPSPDGQDQDDVTIHAIVTDGVPSAGGACSCANTINVNCVAQGIVAAIAKGYGAWVIGIQADFNGNYFPEMGGGKFHFTGRRPIFVWVFSRNLEAGRSLVKAALDISDSLIVEIWPGEWTGTTAAQLTAPSQFTLNDPRACGDASRQPTINSLSTQSVRGNPLGVVAVRRPQSSSVMWKTSIPSVPFNSSSAPLKSFFRTVSGGPSLQVGAHSTWTSASGGCFVLDDSRTVWSTKWRTEIVPGLFDDWSTDQDSTRASATRTLLLTETWATVGQMIIGRYPSIQLPVLQVDLE